MNRKNPPSLIELIDKEETKGGTTFKELIKKLLIHDSQLKGYRFEMHPKYRRLEIDGLVECNYPGMEGMVIFQIKRLKASTRMGAISHQVRKIFQRVVSSKAVFNAYVLVTQEDLTVEQKEWLAKLQTTHNLDLRHYGQEQIVELLNQYPALKKYYYGEYIEEVLKSYNSLKQDYSNAVVNKIRDVEFIGLPTAHYQNRDLLKKTGLIKIYIPLRFRSDERRSRTKELSELKHQFNRLVIMGGPGSGKSTLAKYLALDSRQKDDDDDSVKIEDKIPFIISLSDFVGVKKAKSRSFDYIDYLKFMADSHYYFDNIDRDFFIAMLELGKTMVIFDGLDEIASENWRNEVIEDIENFAKDYPDSSIWVTSRTFGYKKTAGLYRTNFRHFHLTPISPEQSDMFIRNWYEIQIPIATIREKKIKSLQRTFETIPYMQWFKRNPLFLTLLVILNQFEEQLPNNRITLYEKCLELLLSTWPNQLYSAVRKTNPMQEIGINYEKQLELLSAVAVNIQDRYKEKIWEEEEEDEQGILIPGNELLNILFEARFDKERMTEEEARKDVKKFFDYIIDRTGILVEIRIEKVGENEKRFFSFIHRSFREYLYSRSRVLDPGITVKDHAGFIIKYMGKPFWQEVILFYLLLLKENMKQNDIDLIIETIFEALSSMRNPDNWLVMGMAVRDNIGFSDEAVKTILTEIVNHWFVNPEERMVFSILKDIVGCSGKGKHFLKTLIIAHIIQNSAKKAFAAFHLLKQFYTIDDNIFEMMDNHKDKENILPYLPIYRDEAIVSRLIDKNMKVSHWVRYYNTVNDKIPGTLDRIIAYQMGENESKGFILSCWGKMCEIFCQRIHFLASHEKELNSEKIGNINLSLDYVVYGSEGDKIFHPLRLFKPFGPNLKKHDLSVIADRFFISRDREMPISGNPIYLERWAKDVLLKIFFAFNDRLLKSKQFNARELEHIEKESKRFGEEFKKKFNQYFPQVFAEELHRYMLTYLDKGSRFLSENFIQYVSWYFRREFEKFPTRYIFDPVLLRRFSRDLSKAFSRYFRHDFSRDLSRDLLYSLLKYLKQDKQDSEHYFNRDFQQYLEDNQSQKFKDSISNLYFKTLKKRLAWENLSGDQLVLIYNLFLKEFDQDHLSFIDHFYIYLYEYLFNHRFDMSFESGDSSGRFLAADNILIIPKTHLAINNPFMIPFTFNFLLSGALNHYFIKLLAHLHERFYKQPAPSKNTILEAVEDYSYDYPFISYFINYSWDYFCEDFKNQYQPENESNPIRLACFIMHAAKVSLVTDMPCSGDAWEEILQEAEKSDSIFVQISLRFYRLCNHIETARESELLESLLEQFEARYPNDYKLIGFS